MMARIETLSAYRCTFSYLQRNNPLKEELQEKIKADIPPEYTFADFIEDFCKATSSLAKGEVTERAIMLPEENVYSRPSESGVKKWRIVPYAGKQGKPFRIIKTTTGKKYDFGSDSAALYEHNKIFFRVGKRICPVQWNEFDSIMGVYDITDRLHQRFRSSGDFIGELSAISDEYYKSIIKEEDVNAG